MPQGAYQFYKELQKMCVWEILKVFLSKSTSARALMFSLQQPLRGSTVTFDIFFQVNYPGPFLAILFMYRLVYVCLWLCDLVAI